MKSKKKKNKQDSTEEPVTQELRDRRNDIAMADWGIDYDELDPTQKRIVNKTIKSQSPNARSVPSYHMIKPKSVIRKNGTRKVSAPVKSHPVNHELLWQVVDSFRNKPPRRLSYDGPIDKAAASLRCTA